MTPKTQCLAIRDVPSKFRMIVERLNVVCVQFYSLRPTAFACGVVAADDRLCPCSLLMRPIRMPTLPVRVIFSVYVASFDAALVRAEPLLTEGRYRLIVLDLVWFAAALANLCADAALPSRVIFTRPALGTPLSPTFV